MPVKPAFKTLTPKDMKLLHPYFSMRPNKTCDSGGLDTFLWADYYEVEYCLIEGEAILWRMRELGEVYSAMPCCREEKLAKYFRLTEHYFNEEMGCPLQMRLADEEAVKKLDLLHNPAYFVAEQEDLKDYLYEGEKLRTLSGKKLHKKKNQVNKFMREYGERYEYRTLGCMDKEQILSFLAKWYEERKESGAGEYGKKTDGKSGDEKEDADTLEAEICGLNRILQNCNLLEFKAGGIFIDGKLEAFSIGNDNPTEQMAVISIEKANPDITGLYQVINQQFLLHEFPKARIVNREDDVGLEGLRKAKLSYHPVGYARKYLVRQKPL